MTKSKSTKSTPARAGAPERSRSTKTRVQGVPADSPPIPSAEPGPRRRPTKQALILGLLQRSGGASLADLMAATGWLPHTTRAALTRLRQAGHILDRSSGESGAVYCIRAPARPARSRKAA